MDYLVVNISLASDDRGSRNVFATREITDRRIKPVTGTFVRVSLGFLGIFFSGFFKCRLTTE